MDTFLCWIDSLPAWTVELTVLLAMLAGWAAVAWFEDTHKD